MRLFTQLILVLVLICKISAQTDTEIAVYYERWKASNPRCSQGEEEIIYRRQIFIENYKAVIAHNSNPNNTYTLALNQFADISEEEFSAKFLTRNIFQNEDHDENNSSDEDELFRNELSNQFDEDDCSTQPNTSINPDTKGRLLSSPPSSWDWRPKGAVTSVKNQGACGSCWAFSTTGMLEGVNFLRGNPLKSFSEQQLVDCCGKKGYSCQGCNGAWPTWAVSYVKKYGILTSAQYPYVAVEGACKVNSPTNGFYVKQQSYLPSTNKGLKKGIAKQPVSVAVDASKWYLYGSGVFNNCSSKKSKANHAVTAVGYNSSGVWIVKNSWGTGWGQAGYIYLSSGNTCGIQNYALIAKI